MRRIAAPCTRRSKKMFQSMCQFMNYDIMCVGDENGWGVLAEAFNTSLAKGYYLVPTTS